MNNEDIPICKLPNCGQPVKRDKAYPKRWTLFCSRSCASIHTRNTKDDQIKNTCMQRYGGASFLTSPQGKSHLENVFLEKYGVTNPSKAYEVKQLKKTKSIERFGVDNVSKSKEVKDKIQLVRKPYRQYEYILPSGAIIKLQGYENRGVDLLLEQYAEHEIEFKSVPTFNYEFNGSRKYYPDFYIPKDNLIIEVKSTWTMKAQYTRNLLKEKAVIANGFNFRFMIFDASGQLVTIP